MVSSFYSLFGNCARCYEICMISANGWRSSGYRQQRKLLRYSNFIRNEKYPSTYKPWPLLCTLDFGALSSVSLEDDIQNEVFDNFVFLTLILYYINNLHALTQFVACESYAEIEQKILIEKHLHRLLLNIIISKIDTQRVNVTIYSD